MKNILLPIFIVISIFSCAHKDSISDSDEFFHFYGASLSPDFNDRLYSLLVKSGMTDQKSTIYVRNVDSIYAAYYASIYSVRIIDDSRVDVLFFLRNGDKLSYDDGRMISAGSTGLKYKSIFLYRYPDKYTKRDYRYYIGNSSQDMFDSLYGRTDDEITGNLTNVKIFGQGFAFNKKCGAAFALSKAVAEIERRAAGDKEIADWIKSIRMVYTHKSRLIASSENKSMHSYGVAVDFRFRRETGEIYWMWSSYFYGDWWRIPLEKRHHIPDKIIKVFESCGFVWGGKWVNFDIMHFEYRPDIILAEGL